jgi:hypothetical protein
MAESTPPREKSAAATATSNSADFLPRYVLLTRSRTLRLLVRSINEETVEVLVQGGAKFSVHKDVLLQSPFFANALKPEWASMRKDGQPIGFRDAEPDVFGAYVQWLYTHRTVPNLFIGSEI